ncbi:substrate-binding domain-containing protein [Streptomyces bluensis]|uniref:substrate-binding domain-containing protein n=1 Tax=Streptomyces bluensis TaxID=33897 RepID=UPI003570A7C0
MNDRLVLGAYQALAEAGPGVPDDVSVVSFDDDPIAGWLRPGLTTAALPHEPCRCVRGRPLPRPVTEIRLGTARLTNPHCRPSRPGA